MLSGMTALSFALPRALPPCEGLALLMIVCADDFGLTEDINLAILELCGLGRLSAVSCMVTLPQCTRGPMQDLLHHQATVDIGLHLYLADRNSPVSASVDGARATVAVPSYTIFLRRALLRQAQSRNVVAQVSAQYHLFVEKFGRRPDFIDGHLHVHQLPGVREGVIQFALSLPESYRPYIRNTRMELGELRRRQLPWFKAAFIGRFGAIMAKQLIAAGLATNRGFAGIYDFQKWTRFPEYLPRFADHLRDFNGLLVTHPGSEQDWRRQEFETLRRFSFRQGKPNRFLKV